MFCAIRCGGVEPELLLGGVVEGLVVVPGVVVPLVPGVVLPVEPVVSGLVVLLGGVVDVPVEGDVLVVPLVPGVVLVPVLGVDSVPGEVLVPVLLEELVLPVLPVVLWLLLVEGMLLLVPAVPL